MRLDIVVPAVIILLSGAAAYRFVPRDRHRNTFILLALLSILTRMAIVFYLYSAGTEVSGTDGLLYHQEGIGIARQLADGIPIFQVKYSYTWYTVFVGLVYHIFGVNRYLVSYINIFFAFSGALLLLKMALMCRYKFTNAAFICLAFLYFPNLSLWTADSRKESLLIYLCLLCWFLVLRFSDDLARSGGRLKGKKLPLNLIRVGGACLLMWLCTLIRIYMFLPLAAGIIIGQLLLYKKLQSRMCAVFTAAVAVSAILIFFGTVNPLTDSYHAIHFSNEPSVSTAQEVTSKMQTVSAIASSRNVTASIFNFVLLPYPGSINIADLHGNHALEFVVSMDMVAWYLCLLLMVPGIYGAFKKRDSTLMGMMAFLILYVFINALVVENVADTIYRYRSVIVGVSLLFINGEFLTSAANRVMERWKGHLPLNAKQSVISNISIKQ